MRQAAGFGEPPKRLLHSKSRRSENPCATLCLAVIGPKQVRLNYVCNVKRRLHQAKLCPHVNPPNETLFGRSRKYSCASDQFFGPFLKPGKIRGNFSHVCQSARTLGADLPNVFEGRTDRQSFQNVIIPTEPHTYVPECIATRNKTPGHTVYRGCQALPISQAAGQTPSGGQQILREICQLNHRKLDTQELHADFIDLVRLVKDDDPHSGQQFSHSGFPHGEICKEQMMIDDDDVRRKRVTPCQIYVTSP